MTESTEEQIEQFTDEQKIDECIKFSLDYIKGRQNATALHKRIELDEKKGELVIKEDKSHKLFHIDGKDILYQYVNLYVATYQRLYDPTTKNWMII